MDVLNFIVIYIIIVKNDYHKSRKSFLFQYSSKLKRERSVFNFHLVKHTFAQILYGLCTFSEEEKKHLFINVVFHSQYKVCLAYKIFTKAIYVITFLLFVE